MSRFASCGTRSTRRKSVTPRKWTDLNVWTASSVWLKSNSNQVWISTPLFVTKMQSHLHSTEEQCLTAHDGVLQTRANSHCSNLVTTFNFGVSFAIVFAPPLT